MKFHRLIVSYILVFSPTAWIFVVFKLIITNSYFNFIYDGSDACNVIDIIDEGEVVGEYILLV